MPVHTYSHNDGEKKPRTHIVTEKPLESIETHYGIRSCYFHIRLTHLSMLHAYTRYTFLSLLTPHQPKENYFFLSLCFVASLELKHREFETVCSICTKGFQYVEPLATSSFLPLLQSKKECAEKNYTSKEWREQIWNEVIYVLIYQPDTRRRQEERRTKG